MEPKRSTKRKNIKYEKLNKEENNIFLKIEKCFPFLNSSSERTSNINDFTLLDNKLKYEQVSTKH